MIIGGMETVYLAMRADYRDRGNVKLGNWREA
jgi:hypothetical protein